MRKGYKITLENDKDEPCLGFFEGKVGKLYVRFNDEWFPIYKKEDGSLYLKRENLNLEIKE